MATLETRETIRQPRGDKPVRKRAIYYPTGNGKPMAEDTLHRELMATAVAALKRHLRNVLTYMYPATTSCTMWKASPEARVSPDCYVVIGVPRSGASSTSCGKKTRSRLRLCLSSRPKPRRKKTWRIKRPLYEQTLRVAEYFQFDPTGDYLNPRLQGQRLLQGRYQSIELRDNHMFSEQLQLELVAQDDCASFLRSGSRRVAAHLRRSRRPTSGGRTSCPGRSPTRQCRSPTRSTTRRARRTGSATRSGRSTARPKCRNGVGATARRIGSLAPTKIVFERGR